MKSNKREISFLKYSGAGNTFLISSEKLDLDLADKRNFITRLCDPVEGFSVDGVLFLEKKNAVIVWDFYNSDGSTAEMCGNAARCAYSFANEFMVAENKIEFQTLSGIVVGYRSGPLVAVEMTEIKNESGSLSKSFIAEKIENEDLKKIFHREVVGTDLQSIDTGVPHLVFEIKNFADFKSLKHLCSYLRSLPLFPRGTNVTVISKISTNTAKAVTFERGVEDFTLACGTGAVAAAKYLATQVPGKIFNVQMPGGNLVVDFKNKENFPTLIGEAKYIGKVIVNI